MVEYLARQGMMYLHTWRHDVSAEADMMYAPRIRTCGQDVVGTACAQ